MSNDIKKLAIGFEAIRYSVNQSKDGYKITLVVHPDDFAPELMSHPIGTRYQVALVELNDENEPVNQHRTNADRAVESAGMLARNPKFQAWCVEQRYAVDISEDAAKEAIYFVCGIKSRRELATDQTALARFDEMRLKFSKAL